MPANRPASHPENLQSGGKHLSLFTSQKRERDLEKLSI
jgi:hypothetical protein